MKPIIHITCTLLMATIAAPAFGDFSGSFSLTNPSPVPGVYNTTQALGAWNLVVAGTGTGEHSADTTAAPSSVLLHALGLGAAASGTTTLAYPLISQSGTISFDYNLTIANGGSSASGYFIYTHNGATVGTFSSSGSGSGITFNVSSGDTFAFVAHGNGGFIIPVGPNTLGSSDLTLSNFSFTPAAVPEPSTYALLGGLAALGFAGVVRHRARKVTSA